MLYDDDEDLDDPDEPMMEGSDDEFSDLEMDEDIDDVHMDTTCSSAQGYCSNFSQVCIYSPVTCNIVL